MQQDNQRRYSSGQLILGVSAFVAIFSNFAFFNSAASVFGLSAQTIGFFLSLVVSLTSVFVLLLSLTSHRSIVKPALILFLMSSSVLAYFTTKYGTIFDPQMIANALQTDSAEAGDLITPQLFGYVVGLGLLPSLVVWRAPLLWRSLKVESIAQAKLAGVAGLALISAVLAFSGRYASLMREHRDVASKINPAYALVSTVKLAARSLPDRHRPHIVVGAEAKVPPGDRHHELVIMVVGETVRADHWGLNGYKHDTTPLLRREQIINFPDFWACDTSTARSVPCMFSHLGRAGFDVVSAQASDNALDVLSRAGVSVLWRDNNSSSKGVADRVTFQDFKTPKTNTMCQDGECRDEGMLVGLQNYIDAQKGDVLIVLHQMGNHGPAYHKRYPKAFERFTPVCTTSDLGSCTSEQISNAYDNAILYTDHFLSKVIALLKQNDARYETAMVYVSDHGESLGEYGLYLHGAPYALAPDAQKHVPAIIWLGEGIRHEIREDNMEERRKRSWSHDNIFHTLLGLFEVKSTAYDPAKDLLDHLPHD